ncbi:MAG: hypothetical protein AUK44_00235 [Porphyromonadaceae bacterium CG2_30_38_12]|nr:MAG: hypothetical protein AUK44_00235 [Porphyromonadaceae bacterium CG2_30_38_12]
MNAYFKIIVFGLGVFIVFAVIASGLKLVSHQYPIAGALGGLFTKNDLVLGVLVAIVVTITHERKKRIH